MKKGTAGGCVCKGMPWVNPTIFFFVLSLLEENEGLEDPPSEIKIKEHNKP